MIKNIQKFVRAYWKDITGLLAICLVTLALLTIRYISYFAIM